MIWSTILFFRHKKKSHWIICVCKPLTHSPICNNSKLKWYFIIQNGTCGLTACLYCHQVKNSNVRHLHASKWPNSCYTSNLKLTQPRIFFSSSQLYITYLFSRKCLQLHYIYYYDSRKKSHCNLMRCVMKCSVRAHSLFISFVSVCLSVQMLSRFWLCFVLDRANVPIHLCCW